VHYHKNPSVVYTELADGAVLLDLDTKHYYNLNETGVRIWQLIDDAKDASEVAEKLSKEFEVDSMKALASIERLLGDLEKNRLIIRQSG
jgi:hypothetical protein